MPVRNLCFAASSKVSSIFQDSLPEMRVKVWITNRKEESPMIWHLRQDGNWYPYPDKDSGWKTIEEKEPAFAQEMRAGYGEWAKANEAVQHAERLCGLSQGG